MKAEQQYIELFGKYENIVGEYASDVLNAPRAQAFDDFKRLGFPTTKSEDYKHTDVAQAFAPDYGVNLKRLEIPVNPYDVFRCDVPHLSTALYFVVNDSFYDKQLPDARLPEGVYAGGLKTFTELHPDIARRYYAQAASSGKDGIIALNTMLAQDGFVLYVPENVAVERPIQLVHIFRSDVDTMANRRVLVIMEPRSQAKLLVCDHSIDRVSFLSTEVIEIFAGEGACFDYYDLEESAESTTRFASLHVRQEALSNVLVNGITLNNGLTRNNYFIELNGEYAQATLCGMSILDKRQQVDTYSHITHAAPHCTSNELFKNVLNDRSTGVFSGRILVKEGAQKTVAYQTNRNLCATSEARACGKPQLEIYADDVKCSHGMTTGQLDENALFYLRSRGIPAAEALTMLSIAFTADVVDNVRLDGLKERLHSLIEKRFRGELAQCAGCRTAHGGNAQKIIIAIDGHSSGGKSTMAKELAREIGYTYIDTGAMYRAVTLYAIRHGFFADGEIDEQKLRDALPDIRIAFRRNEATGNSDACLNGENVESAIRSMDVASRVSLIAALPFVRRDLVAKQQEMGRDKGVVMDGRDIGTMVFPDAELKIFVTATPEIRARRRVDELAAKGEPASFDEVLENIKTRDHIDSTRAEGPLRKAHDALTLDNSDMTPVQQKAWLMQQYNRTINSCSK